MEKDSSAPSLAGGTRLLKPSLKPPRGAPDPDTADIARAPLGGVVSDMSRRKKVKLADSAGVHELSLKDNASSRQTENILASNFKEAKTSEYRSFMKLREETHHKLHTHFPKQDINVKTFATNNRVKELNYSVARECSNDSSSLPIQKVSPVAQSVSLSPAKVSENYELTRKGICKYDISRSLSPIGNVTSTSQGSSLLHVKVSQDYEPKYKHEGMFSKKRVNIVQLAAKASPLEKDDLKLNRSDLISGLLERLGTGRILDKLDELQKSGEKKSNGIGHRRPSCRTDSYLHETVGSELSGTTTREHLGKNLLPYRHSKANDLLTSSVDYTVAQVFPTWHAFETDLLWEKNRRVLDDGGIPCLPAENKSVSDIELHEIAGNDFFECTAMKNLERNLLAYRCSKADDFTPSIDYGEAQAFPTRHALETGLECKRKYKWLLVNETNSDMPSEGKSASDIELHGTAGMDLFETTSRKYLWKDFLTYKGGETNDCFPSSVDYVEAHGSPPWRAPITDAQCKRRKCKWIIDDESIQEMLSEDKLASATEWNTGFGSDNCRYHTVDHVPYKSDYFILDNFPSCCQLTEQTFVPFLFSTSLELCNLQIPDLNLQSAEEQCTLRLLGWDENIENKQELTVFSDGVSSKEMGHLPLTLYTPSDLLHKKRGYGCIDGYESRTTFNSQPDSNSMITFGNASYHSLDVQFSKPISDCEMAPKGLPINSDRGHSKFQFYDTKMKGLSNWMSAEDMQDGSLGEQSLVEFQNQFPGDICSLTDFSSFGLKFSDSEKGIFTLLPDRLRWY